VNTTLRSVPDATTPPGRDFGWRVHEAQEQWISRVDVKASVVLAFEGALVVLALTGQSLLYPNRTTTGVALGLAGVVLLLAGIICAGAAVWPHMGRSRTLRQEAGNHFIYFGHVRHSTMEQLSGQLAAMTDRDELDMLARQIVSSGRINWSKHRLIQWSLALGFLAMALLATMALLPMVATLYH